MMSNNNTKERLMKQIQAYCFAAYDALLFLDAYPNSKEALSFYNKNKKLEQRAVQEYEAKYGPIKMPSDTASWEWTNGPWPWQLEGKR